MIKWKMLHFEMVRLMALDVDWMEGRHNIPPHGQMSSMVKNITLVSIFGKYKTPSNDCSPEPSGLHNLIMPKNKKKADQ